MSRCVPSAFSPAGESFYEGDVVEWTRRKTAPIGTLERRAGCAACGWRDTHRCANADEAIARARRLIAEDGCDAVA